MPPTEHAEGIPSALVPLAAGAAHLQQLCDMLATSNLRGRPQAVERTQRAAFTLISHSALLVTSLFYE